MTTGLWITRSLTEPLKRQDSAFEGSITIGRALILTADEAAAAILPRVIEESACSRSLSGRWRISGRITGTPQSLCCFARSNCLMEHFATR
jgi:hypothetical protein